MVDAGTGVVSWGWHNRRMGDEWTGDPSTTSSTHLLLPSFNRISVLASNNLDPRRSDLLVRFHFKAGVLDDERPDVVAETIRVEVTL